MTDARSWPNSTLGYDSVVRASVLLFLAVGSVFLDVIFAFKPVLQTRWEHVLSLAINWVFLVDLLLSLYQKRANPLKGYLLTWPGGMDLLATVGPLLAVGPLAAWPILGFLRIARVYRMISTQDPLYAWMNRVYSEHRYLIPERVPPTKKLVDDLMLLAALATIALFVYETVTASTNHALEALSIGFDLLFFFDYSLRAVFSARTSRSPGQGKLRGAWDNYIGRWYGIVDLLAWLFPVLTHLFGVGFGGEEYSRITRMLRLLRMARLLRLLRAFRWFKETEHLHNTLKRFLRVVNKEIAGSIGILAILILLCSFYLVEAEASKFRHLGDAIHWSILGILGQEDGSDLINPWSKYIGIFILFCGIVLVGFITGAITSFFMDRMDSRISGQEAVNAKDHVVICGYSSKLQELIRFLVQGGRTSTVVLLFDRGNEKEDVFHDDPHLHGVSREAVNIQWVRGDSRTYADLHRSSVEKAQAVIVLADESRDAMREEDRDAHTFMTISVLRDYLGTHHGPHVEEHGGIILPALRTVKEFLHKPPHSASAERSDPSSNAVRFPTITAEVLMKESCESLCKIEFWDKSHPRIVYTDELLAKYFLLHVVAQDSIAIYDKLIDPLDQVIVRKNKGAVYMDSHSTTSTHGSEKPLSPHILLGSEKSSVLVMSPSGDTSCADNCLYQNRTISSSSLVQTVQAPSKNTLLICGSNSRLPEILEHVNHRHETGTVVVTERSSETWRIPYQVRHIKKSPRIKTSFDSLVARSFSTILILADEGDGGMDEEDRDSLTIMSLHAVISAFAQNDCIIVEMLTAPGVRVARTMGVKVIYADELVSKYLLQCSQSVQNSSKNSSGTVHDFDVYDHVFNAELFRFCKMDLSTKITMIEELEHLIQSHPIVALSIDAEWIFDSLKGNKPLYYSIEKNDVWLSDLDALFREYCRNPNANLLNDWVAFPSRSSDTKWKSNTTATPLRWVILNPGAHWEILQEIIQQAEARKPSWTMGRDHTPVLCPYTIVQCTTPDDAQ